MTALSIAPGGVGARWRFRSSCPADWSTRIEQCRAGFFHSPAGLTASLEAGDPFFGELVDGEDVIGIVAGVERRCRVPPRPRHACLPAAPALAPGVEMAPDRAIELLIDNAREEGWTDLTVHSFEAGQATPAGAGTMLSSRNEYDIPLAGTPEDLRKRLSSNHRRRLPDAGAGWALRTLSGADARALVSDVMHSAERRSEERRGVAYAVTLPPAEGFREDPAWGLTTYAVMLGEQPLAAVLVGWAGKRAYYVSGGSTPEGYARNASVWLHLQIAQAFQSAGFTHYCLGGAPASAVEESDPSHGLHRFKTGFGATIRPCSGARWVFRAEHEAGHRVTRWLVDHLTHSKKLA